MRRGDGRSLVILLRGAAGGRLSPRGGRPPPARASPASRARPWRWTPAQRTITIAHEDIPGFMPAMTMDFVVLEKDAPLLARVSPGDEVSGDARGARLALLARGPGGGEEGHAGPERQAASARARGGQPGDAGARRGARRPGRPAAAGCRELHGRAYALTFVFTRCPLPDFCPLMMRNFAAAEALLVADAALRDAHAAAHGQLRHRGTTPRPCCAPSAGRSRRPRPPFTHWLLATGPTRRSARSPARSSSTTSRRPRRSPTTCARPSSTRSGRLARLFRGNDWKPEELVAALRAAAKLELA